MQTRRNQSKKPTVKVARSRPQPRKVIKAEQSSRIISGTELFGTVLSPPSPVSYATAGYYPINPASALLCPRAAVESALYQKYRIRRLRVRYEPTVGSYLVNSGVLYMFRDPNIYDLVPLDQVYAMQNQESTSGRIFDKCHLDILKNNQPLYTCEDALHLLEDLKTYYHGYIGVATAGLPATLASGTEMGRLFIDYEFELLIRQPTGYLTSGVRTIFANTPAVVGQTNPAAASATMTFDALSVANAPAPGEVYASSKLWYSRLMRAESGLVGGTYALVMPQQNIKYKLSVYGQQIGANGVVSIGCNANQIGIKSTVATLAVGDHITLSLSGLARNVESLQFTFATTAGQFQINSGNVWIEPV